MTRRRIRFTATARQHVRLFQRWWQENSLRPEILHHNLRDALNLLSNLPGVGSLYPTAPLPGVRRLYLERLRSHLYYTYDEREVLIRALWHTSRGSGPDLTAG